MSNLSEEEIIKNVKEMIQWSDHNTYKMALQGLLNLYNDLKQDYIDLDKECREEKEKIEELQNYMKEYLIPKSTINLIYISKDKIKEKIEEYKELVNDFEEYWSKDPRKFSREKCCDYYKIEALEELLKGE